MKPFLTNSQTPKDIVNYLFIDLIYKAYNKRKRTLQTETQVQVLNATHGSKLNC